MPTLEIEYKTLLSQEHFIKLSQIFQDVPVFSQTNHYFDTQDLDLRKNKLSLRIRTLSDRAELTLKIPQMVGNLEHNFELTLKDAAAILKANQLPLNSVTQLICDRGFDLTSIHCLGYLTTHRRETELPIGLLAIDENHYNNHTDYELELEVSEANKGQKDFDNFLINHHIPFKAGKSKVVRFLKSSPYAQLR